jgi:hypothetical protein
VEDATEDDTPDTAEDTDAADESGGDVSAGLGF